MRYETVRMILEIKRRMTDDALYTSHRPATDGDAKRLSTWPSGGIVQVAHGLLVEALHVLAQLFYGWGEHVGLPWQLLCGLIVLVAKAGGGERAIGVVPGSKLASRPLPPMGSDPHRLLGCCHRRQQQSARGHPQALIG